MMGGHALEVLPVMWVFVAIVFVFVGLRLYTRIRLIDSLRPDDYAYTMSSMLLLFYTIFLQVAAIYGLGQNTDTLSDDDAAKAIMWEMVGLTIAFLGMAVAKWSLGLFLLRFVLNRWQRIAIWAAMTILLFLSILTCILFWLQCLPVLAIFDQRVQGTCKIRILPLLQTLGIWGVLVDFYFAIVPWFCVWSLKMSNPEKATIAGSMSLGVIAGICGIVRNVNLDALDNNHSTTLTICFVAWTAAEIFVTLICIGIPSLRPLYIGCFPTLFTSRRLFKYGKHNGDEESSPTAVFSMYSTGVSRSRTIGATPESDRGFPDAPAYLGIRGPYVRTEISGQFSNFSQEETLCSDNLHNVALQDVNAIVVRDDVIVEYAPGRMSQSCP